MVLIDTHQAPGQPGLQRVVMQGGTEVPATGLELQLDPPIVEEEAENWIFNGLV